MRSPGAARCSSAASSASARWGASSRYAASTSPRVHATGTRRTTASPDLDRHQRIAHQLPHPQPVPMQPLAPAVAALRRPVPVHRRHPLQVRLPVLHLLGDLRPALLAGRHPAVQVENPRRRSVAEWFCGNRLLVHTTPSPDLRLFANSSRLRRPPLAPRRSASSSQYDLLLPPTVFPSRIISGLRLISPLELPDHNPGRTPSIAGGQDRIHLSGLHGSTTCP